MKEVYLPRVAGLCILGVFVANVYIGLYDSNLYAYNMVHYYLNWAITAVDVVAAAILFIKSRNTLWVALSGIIWPVVYLLSLGGDVATSMCLGTPTNSNCWPTVGDSFKYLILGYASEGWSLWQYTIPTVIALLVIALILSAFYVRLSRRKKAPPLVRPTPPPEEKPVPQGPMPSA